MFLNAKIFLFSLCFKGAKLAKFIRFEAVGKLMWDEVRDASISITKFTKYRWNDGVFEGSEEHWKLWRCEVEIFCFLKRFFTLLRFVQNDRVLFCTQELEIWTISVFKRKDFFYSHYVFKGAKLAKFIRFEAVGKMMWWCGDVMMRWCEVVNL